MPLGRQSADGRHVPVKLGAGSVRGWVVWCLEPGVRVAFLEPIRSRREPPWVRQEDLRLNGDGTRTH